MSRTEKNADPYEQKSPSSWQVKQERQDKWAAKWDWAKRAGDPKRAKQAEVPDEDNWAGKLGQEYRVGELVWDNRAAEVGWAEQTRETNLTKWVAEAGWAERASEVCQAKWAGETGQASGQVRPIKQMKQVMPVGQMEQARPVIQVKQVGPVRQGKQVRLIGQVKQARPVRQLKQVGAGEADQDSRAGKTGWASWAGESGWDDQAGEDGQSLLGDWWVEWGEEEKGLEQSGGEQEWLPLGEQEREDNEEWPAAEWRALNWWNSAHIVSWERSEDKKPECFHLLFLLGSYDESEKDIWCKSSFVDTAGEVVTKAVLQDDEDVIVATYVIKLVFSWMLDKGIGNILGEENPEKE